MAGLPGFNQRHQYIEPIPGWCVAFGVHQAFDLLECTLVVALTLDRRNVHPVYSSNLLRVDSVVLAVRTDKADVDDPIGIIDPDDNAIFITTYVEHNAPIFEYARSGNDPLDLRR
jgi:hypothetical protein